MKASINDTTFQEVKHDKECTGNRTRDHRQCRSADSEDGCNARGSESICNLYPGAGR